MRDLTGIIIAAITSVTAIVVAIIPLISKRFSQKSKKRLRESETLNLISNRTYHGYTNAYQQAIKNDPRISTLQILDMSKPLSVISVYIKISLYEQAGSGYRIDEDLLTAQESRNPNLLLNAERRYLEKLINLSLDPEYAILKYKRCIVVGDPGAGKTTLLKYLALKAVTKKDTKLPPIPIHVELSAFIFDKQNDLLLFAATAWQNRYGIPKSIALNCIKKSLEDKSAFFLLDALDEVASGNTIKDAENVYNFILQKINDLSSRYPDIIIVVTARKASYYQKPMRLVGFNEFAVLDFQQKDINQFVDQWFANNVQKSKANADELKLKLEQNSRLLALAANPLLLSLITIVYQAELDLPDRRTELYKQCVDILFTKWDASRDIIRRREFKTDQKRQLMQEIAWFFHTKGQRYFSETDLLQFISDFLPIIGLLREQSMALLQEIATENGLLKEQAKGWYGFMHLTIQEYFVAQYVSINNEIGNIFPYRHEPWWEEVILLYAGLAADTSLLIESLLNNINFRKSTTLPTDNSIQIDKDLLLAAKILAAKPTIRKIHLRKSVINELCEVMFKTQRADERQIAASSLVEIGGTELNNYLLHLLKSENVSLAVRQSLVYTLIRQKKYFAIKDLIELAINKKTDKSLITAITVNLDTLSLHGIASVLEEHEKARIIAQYKALVEFSPANLSRKNAQKHT